MNIFKSQNYKRWVGELDTYKENKDLEIFNIIHMYPTKNESGDGKDSLLFNVVIFNADTGEKRYLDGKIALIFRTAPSITKIFIDGSTLIDFARLVKLTWVNAPVIEVTDIPITEATNIPIAVKPEAELNAVANLVGEPDPIVQETMNKIADDILAGKKKKK